MKENCNDKSLLIAEENPACSPDSVERWFSDITSEIELSDSVDGINCILDKVNTVRRNCRTAPFTKYFLKDAISRIRNLANSKIKTITQRNDISKSTYASGKRSTSSLEALQRALEEEDKKTKDWIY